MHPLSPGSLLKLLTLTCALAAGQAFVSTSAARADVDLSGVLLLGTGVDTDAHNNPYRFQFGGAAELTVSGFVMGFRATRSVASNEDCGTAECAYVNDLRTIGGDLGFDWEVAMFHISPRLGLGYLNEKDGDRVAGYFEPGGVVEAEIGWFVGGVDLRYRLAVKEKPANGFLAYARLGLRF